MNIVYISSSTIPSKTANSIHVMKMCQAFAINGHAVTLIAPDKQSDIAVYSGNDFAFYNVKQNFSIVKLPWLKIKGRGYIYALMAAIRSKREEPNFVYSRNLISAFFATIFKQRVVFESHSPISDKGILHQYIFKGLIKKATFIKLVVITQSLRNHYSESYPGIKNIIFVAPDGADPVSEKVDKFHFENDDKQRLKVGYVGNLYQGKGMEIVSELVNMCPLFDFHVVGGTEKDIIYWKDKISDFKNISFHGYVEHHIVESYIKSFDVLLLPNQENVASSGGIKENIGSWTSPLKAFEYMSAGKAILVSRLPVLQEVFEDKVNCLFCSPTNVKEWCIALELLQSNTSLRERLGKSAKEIFLAKYTWKSRSENIIEHLQE
jgi:glycosyltransferase involved in cell wall biosynthesis